MPRKRHSDREGLSTADERDRSLRRTDLEDEAEEAEELLRKEGRIRK